MGQRIAHITLVVTDYDEAIEFYTKNLNFNLLEDTKVDEEKRWVVIAPADAKECSLLLARATNEIQRACIGNQTGGRVGFFLFTDNFWQDYRKMLDKGVSFISTPKEEPYGIVAVFADLYGNKWDLLEPREKANRQP